MSRRFNYKVVEVKPKFLGLRPKQLEETLSQLGNQGWELVNVVQTGFGTWLYLKKEV
ncbi:DUF4177 domain-containing protein [Lysobacter tyrosinilyticus]